jgi:hypothetical protein
MCLELRGQQMSMCSSCGMLSSTSMAEKKQVWPVSVHLPGIGPEKADNLASHVRQRGVQVALVRPHCINIQC